MNADETGFQPAVTMPELPREAATEKRREYERAYFKANMKKIQKQRADRQRRKTLAEVGIVTEADGTLLGIKVGSLAYGLPLL